MTVFDIIVAVILGLCFLFSLFKGIIREVFSLLGYLAGYVLALNYQDDLAELLKEAVAQPIIPRIAGFVIIFLVVRISFGLLGRLIRRFMVSSTVLSIPDRIFGGVLGLAKGLVITAIVMFPLSLFEDTYKKATQGSVLAPYLEQIANFVSQEAHERNLLDKFPKISVDDVKSKMKQLSDLNKLSQDMKEKRDDLFREIQEKAKQAVKDKPQEEYSDEDKDKLKKMLNTFSDK